MLKVASVPLEKIPATNFTQTEDNGTKTSMAQFACGRCGLVYVRPDRVNEPRFGCRFCDQPE